MHKINLHEPDGLANHC